jgi:hypothetical protein
MDKKPPKPPSQEPAIRVARYLCAAYIAAVQGAGFDYTRKKFADEPIAKFWLEMAELAIERDHMIYERGCHPVPPGRPIQ